MAPGESKHGLGQVGVLDAKTWLERTARATVTWTVYSAPTKVSFDWPDGSQFSMDARGHLLVDEIDGHAFLAEVKNYSGVGDQPQEFASFLAKCYSIVAQRPDEFERFLWITWHPFSQTKWSNIAAPTEVASAASAEPHLSLGTKQPSDQVCELVAKRVWVVLMSEASQTLLPTDEMIMQMLVGRQHINGGKS